MRRQRTTLVLLGLGIGVHALAHGAIGLATGLLASALARGASHHGISSFRVVAGEAFGLSEPPTIIFFGLVGTFVKGASGIFLAFIQARTASGYVDEVRRDAVRTLLASGAGHAAPRVLATLSSRARELELAVGAGVLQGVRSAAQLVPLGLALILLSSRLALVGMLALLPFAFSIAWLRRRWRRSMRAAQEQRDEVQVGLDDLVRNLDLWRCYGAGARAEAALAAAAQRASASAARVEAGRSALSSFNEVLAVLALLGCVSLANVLGEPLLDASLLGFAAVFFLTYRPLRDLGDSRAWVQRGSIALEAIQELGTPAESVSAPCAPTRFAPQPEPLELRACGARDYGPVTSLSALPGEIVALVGDTGSGKTTLLRVLLGLEAARGTVRYGGSPLSHVPPGPDYRPFAWVPQEAPLLDATLIENVALFGTGEQAARRALELIGADGLRELEGTPVGPGGRKLSGGERRLTALARALASGLPVLLLDEPLAGLDSAARRNVLSALERLKGRHTILITTHSAEIRDLADRVVAVGDSLSELGEEPRVVLEQDPDVGDAVA